MASWTSGYDRLSAAKPQRTGVPGSGAFDTTAAELAQRLVGNAVEEACLEITMGSAVLRTDRAWQAWFWTSVGVCAVVCGFAVAQLLGVRPLLHPAADEQFRASRRARRGIERAERRIEELVARRGRLTR